MPKNTDFDSAFTQLKEIFEPYADKLNVAADTRNYYALETHHVMKNKRRLYFGGVRRGKAYVSFHLMPVYACPDITEKISPDLKKRMQGKSCFNFTTIDPAHVKIHLLGKAEPQPADLNEVAGCHQAVQVTFERRALLPRDLQKLKELAGACRVMNALTHERQNLFSRKHFC